MHWYTEDEIRFLQTIGTHVTFEQTKTEEVSRERKLQLLQGYREGMNLRSDWQFLDRERIEGELEQMIVHASQK